MKLYEAIRLGAMLRPQCFGQYRTVDGRACALGGALEAVGIKFFNDEFGNPTPHISPSSMWPELMRLRVEVRLGGNLVKRLEVAIIERNDSGWTREAIAEWLQPIEEAYLAQRAHDAHVDAIKARLDEAEVPVGVSR